MNTRQVTINTEPQIVRVTLSNEGIPVNVVLKENALIVKLNGARVGSFNAINLLEGNNITIEVVKNGVVADITVSSGSNDGIWITVGTFDASGGALPTTGGNGPGGAFKQNNMLKVVVGDFVYGLYVPAGSYIMAQQDDPTNDWDVLTGWVIK